ncbi:MAG: hypothetical protein RLZZ106_251 [Cyanobacteriota bacterium]|jgi:hypothetical protein
MRLSWSQHLSAARTLELVGDEHAGTALALMGVAVLMLLQDLAVAAETPSDQPGA